ncbi:DEHA2B02200p [Debaryomyces hansenii CBS767]|uniref:DEHA2B02200p n=1 Tax=Debaryomyces hansenii (strain ATCC 36239 / CBS 767 / BCRC 21394 / JCM 1990 / NBRC 0083 / IGC 2968) TaxID=284592 RepID=Q6BXK6_DEBHA|nr:DEHA2B02200p [Debaryomyces hansenii CBS767]CAG85049.2 DEHA2B02200p [Debaryomyces hansenii CBS767]|eukprot:XP_457063.2 DEHA2B02200p [Debaryomyces hansenii CBS767]
MLPSSNHKPNKSGPSRDIHEMDSGTQLDLLPMIEKNDLSDSIPTNGESSNNTVESGVDYSNLVMKTINPKPSYVPPLNFSLVEDGIYRSGFPMPINYPFLEQLGIKTIIYLGDLGEKKKDEKSKKKNKKNKEEGDKTPKEKEKKDKHGTAEIMDNYKKWIETTDIKFHDLFIKSASEPFTLEEDRTQALETIKTALQLIVNKQNFPILIHSNKGKHRIGVLVGLMRKLLQGWCLSGIFEEYEKFAMGKSEFDLECIELWQPELYVENEWKPDFVRS